MSNRLHVSRHALLVVVCDASREGLEWSEAADTRIGKPVYVPETTEGLAKILQAAMKVERVDFDFGGDAKYFLTVQARVRLRHPEQFTFPFVRQMLRLYGVKQDGKLNGRTSVRIV